MQETKRAGAGVAGDGEGVMKYTFEPDWIFDQDGNVVYDDISNRCGPIIEELMNAEYFWRTRCDALRAERDAAVALLAEFLDLWDGYELTAALPFEMRERIEAIIDATVLDDAAKRG